VFKIVLKSRWCVFVFYRSQAELSENIYNEHTSTQENDERIIEDMEGENDGLPLTNVDNVEEYEPLK